MRKLGDALLIVPALALLALGAIGGQVRRRPVIGVIAVIAIGTLTLFALTRPTPGAATQPTILKPVSAALLETVATGHALRAPFTVSFDTPMDAPSVAAALRISPDEAVTFSWDSAGRTLTVTPVDAWAEGTLYTITIDTTAHGTDGAALAAPVRAVVLTAGHAEGSIAATGLSAGKARLDTAFAITLDHPATLAAVRDALTTAPVVAGNVTAGASPSEFVFTPDDTLSPGTEYTLALRDLLDVNGLRFDPAPSLTVTSVTAPKIVRFRPKNGTTGVARSSQMSVRFTAAMDRKSTIAALSVTADGKAVKGKVTWAEKDVVLIFTPASALPYKSIVVMTIADTARSKEGAPLETAGVGKFTVAAKPKVITTTIVPRPTGSGGGGAVAGTWTAVEVYYLKLMNCTRTGGLVTTSGSCSSPGGRNVAPLVINEAISSKVTRPYAKLLAVRAACNHYLDGDPGFRLRRAGFTSYRWGENIGCGNVSTFGTAYKAMLADHLFFQGERSYNGGHYVNLMDARYNQVGIGVWVTAGRCRLVVDFYHP